MFGVSRTTKKVTYSLDYEARARLIAPHYVSSGSEHSPEPDSDVISDLLFNFPAAEDEGSRSPSPPPPELEEERPDVQAKRDPNVADLIKPIVVDDSDEFRNALKGHVLRALQLFAGEDDEQVLRRKVMGYLREEAGYDAAVCKTKWKSGGGVTAGEHEFLDVVDSRRRYFVDVDFRSEFAIAKPTATYELGVQTLPRVFVGRGEQLKTILRVMSDAARRSFKSGGLLTPPWRKHRFLQNMWLGGYRRTVSVCPEATSFRADGGSVDGVVLCRAVGFDGALVLSAAGRTR